MWKKAEPIVEREDVDAALAALMDIRRELVRIRTMLEEDDDPEGTDA
jgi:hypothetical protein